VFRTLLHLTLLSLSGGVPTQEALFTAGQGGYHNYRIPSLIVTSKGTVLAFAEGRSAMSDTGNVDIVLRRSMDGGRTWGPMQVVAEDGDNTVGNPCPVVDRQTGTIWLLLNWNLGKDDIGPIIRQKSTDTRRIRVTHSEDEGLTWARPVDITKAVKPADWTWHATGPGCGIQLQSGRLVIPCDHVSATTGQWGSHILYSDNGGKSWHRGGQTGPGTNESQVVQLLDGTLLLNMRNAETKDRSKPHHRLISTSHDSGLTWSRPHTDSTLIEPSCQAALIRYPNDKHDLLIFSNPAGAKREKMTLRLSDDAGTTWAHSRLLYAGPSAYSALAVTKKGEILCLYERGVRTPYENITLARCPLAWLSEPAGSP
jgi:sialidase-1